MRVRDLNLSRARAECSATMGLTTAILTTRNSAMISMGQKPENVRMAAENTTIFLDFQAEYEGSIPFTRSKAISMA